MAHVCVRDMRSSMARLPEEIQAYILSRLNGASAAKAKRVCKLWNELITGLETCLHFWLWCCLKEMPTSTLVELTRLMQLCGGRETTLCELAKDWSTSLGCKLPWMFWREVYAEHHRCKFISSPNEKRTVLHYFPLNGEVSCLHVQDNIIFSGHESGVVMSWRNIEAEMNCDVIYRHKRRVTSIAGLDMVTTTDKILNGELSNLIVSSSRDTTLMLHNIDLEETTTIKEYSKQVNSVRSWDNKFVAAADGTYHLVHGQPIWTVTDQSEPSATVTCQLISQSAGDMKAVAFWDNTVICGDELGNVFQYTVCRDCGRWDGKPPREEMVHIASLDSPVKELFLHGSRVVCLTADGFLHIRHSLHKDTGTFVSIDVHEAIMQSPECLAIRGSILALGCRAGSVYLYHLPKDRDWELLDLAKPAKIVQTNADHVNAIAIGDDGGGPFVVIATEGCYMTVLQWRRPVRKRSENSKKK